MEILGIGPLEFLFILVIALIVLGPRGMVKYSQQAGAFIRRIVQSPAWRAMMDSTQEIKKAQQQFMRDSGLNDTIREIERDVEPSKFISDQMNNSIRNTTPITATGEKQDAGGEKITSEQSGSQNKSDDIKN